MEHLALYAVIIPDALHRWIKWFSCMQVDTDDIAISMLILMDKQYEPT